MTTVAAGLEFIGVCLVQAADLETCESGCVVSGRTLEGPDGRPGWYELRLLASAHVDGDCGPNCYSQWIEHTAQRCRDRRAGLDAIAVSLGFPSDPGWRAP